MHITKKCTNTESKCSSIQHFTVYTDRTIWICSHFRKRPAIHLRVQVQWSVFTSQRFIEVFMGYPAWCLPTWETCSLLHHTVWICVKHGTVSTSLMKMWNRNTIHLRGETQGQGQSWESPELHYGGWITQPALLSFFLLGEQSPWVHWNSIAEGTLICNRVCYIHCGKRRLSICGMDLLPSTFTTEAII